LHQGKPKRDLFSKRCFTFKWCWCFTTEIVFYACYFSFINWMSVLYMYHIKFTS
jgi:hypothetical protein